MNKPIWFNRVNQWVYQRSLKALENAYEGAVAIKVIEDQHFEGKKISPDSERGKSVYDYFQGILERELFKVRFNLTQVRLGNFLNPLERIKDENISGEDSSSEMEVLQTLAFIESVIGKYRQADELEIPSLSKNEIAPTSSQETVENPPNEPSILAKPSGGTKLFFNLPQNITPEYEQKVIQQLRFLRQERKIAIRFLLILLIVPLAVQISVKNLVYEPLIDWVFVDSVKIENIKLNDELTERFFDEFSRLKERLEIKDLLGIGKDISAEKKRKILRDRALELGREAASETLNGWKNLLSDLTAFGVFALLLVVYRKQFTIMRDYLSRSFLQQSDVIKVFVFILLTDMFVGFHSAEGWEVILDSLFEHFSLPTNHNFIFLFIATVPVIMDSIFKLLIFNYLTRKSPTSVAILEKMQQ